MSIPPRRVSSAIAAASFCLIVALSSVAQAADPLFIDQIPNGLTPSLPPNFGALLNQHSTATPSFVPSPQFAAPHLASANLATTVEIGNRNNVTQTQNGTGDQSTVGIIAGNSNTVGVTQNGNNLLSNLLLIGTQGMHVNVLQPPGSPPVNMAIIHAPAATLIIKH
ncbi:MAG TPA: hypothetical protein VFC56_19415 [Stellaceae bacterium]|nr:hypothetical protein [Stellaceae bacterium]